MRKRIFSLLLVIILLFGSFSVDAFARGSDLDDQDMLLEEQASSWCNDYLLWSQNMSAYQWMNDYGCYVVAEAKLIRETGIDTSAAFNPDVYYLWLQNNGLIDSSGMLYSDNPVRYARALGNNNLSYEGTTWSDCNSKAYNNKLQGNKYSILCRNNGVSDHFFYLNNNATTSASSSGIYIWDSWTGSARPSRSYSIAERSYTLSRVITFVYNGTPGVHDPQGVVDSITGGPGTVTIRGWAFDKDSPSTELQIHVYIGAPSSAEGGEGHSGIPGGLIYREDVNKTYGITGNHGFSATVPTNKTGTQPVYVYAVNVGEGSNKVIGSGTVTITDAHKPVGALDSCSGGAGTVSVRGWAFDRDEPSTSIDINVYVGGPSHAAGGEGFGGISGGLIYREDVNNTYGITGNHGYSTTLTTTKRGTQTVYVYAINVGEGSNQLIGSATVNITEPDPTHTHTWGEPVYEWAEDNSSVTASRTCTIDPSHIETETVSTSSRITKLQTCEEEGERTYTSLEFDNSAFEVQEKIETLEALGHDYGDPQYIWAEDNTALTAIRICDRNSQHCETETVPVTVTITTEPTCEEEGEGVFVSSAFENNAFEAQEKTDTIDALGHDWGDEKITVKEPGCLMPGYKAIFCSRCNKTKDEEVIPATGHNWGEWQNVTEAACGEQGQQVRVCANNPNHKEYRDVDVLPHQLKKTERIEAGCETPGNTEYWKCSVCHKFFADASGENEITETQTIIPALGHDWETEKTADTEPTCTEAGYKSIHCTRCDKTKDGETIPATGHAWGAWQTITEPTCTEKGQQVRVCGNDENHKQYQDIDKVPHDLTKVQKAEADCENAGHLEHWQCSFCGKIFADAAGTTELTEADITIPAINHDWNTPVYGWSEDNTSVTAIRTCKKNSSHVESETVGTVAVVSREATCEIPGQTTYIAVFTNPVFSTQSKALENIPATDHAWGEWQEAEASTCIHKGQEVRICANDTNHKEYRDLELSSHTLEMTECKEADCVNEGNIDFWTCSVCGKVFSDENGTVEIAPEDTKIPLTDHTWDEGSVTEEATFYNTGTIEYTCMVCHETRTEEIPVIPVKNMKLNKSSIILDPGENALLNAIVSSGTVPAEYIEWKSSDNKIVTVDSEGEITGIKQGKAIITAKLKDKGVEAKCEVRVLFADVNREHGFYSAVYWANDNGIAAGYSGAKEGIFGVSDNITRGQVMMFLWRAANKPEPKSNAQTFNDVPTDHNFYKAIQWGVEQGITGGYTGKRAGTFGPTDNCTRGQIAMFLWRFAGKEEPSGTGKTFTDVPKSNNFYTAIMWASENGITAGYSDGTFGVNRTCTRGHCVTFLYRLMK